MEETRIKKLPPPELNDGIIDAVPVRRKDISTIKAHKKRMYYFVAEDFEERWKNENPELYQAVFRLKDSLIKKYTEDTKKSYKDLPVEFLQEIDAKIKDAWDEALTEYALKTYAWFTPNPPELLEAPVRE